VLDTRAVIDITLITDPTIIGMAIRMVTLMDTPFMDLVILTDMGITAILIGIMATVIPLVATLVGGIVAGVILVEVIVDDELIAGRCGKL